jgi:hypothetical protein
MSGLINFTILTQTFIYRVGKYTHKLASVHAKMAIFATGEYQSGAFTYYFYSAKFLVHSADYYKMAAEIQKEQKDELEKALKIVSSLQSKQERDLVTASLRRLQNQVALDDDNLSQMEAEM